MRRTGLALLLLVGAVTQAAPAQAATRHRCAPVRSAKGRLDQVHATGLSCARARADLQRWERTGYPGNIHGWYCASAALHYFVCGYRTGPMAIDFHIVPARGPRLRRCGRYEYRRAGFGVDYYASRHTSCALARVVAKKAYGKSVPSYVSVRSPITHRRYRIHLTGATEVLDATGPRGIHVRLKAV